MGQKKKIQIRLNILKAKNERKNTTIILYYKTITAIFYMVEYFIKNIHLQMFLLFGQAKSRSTESSGDRGYAHRNQQKSHRIFDY